jgi:diacylglycerol kinase (ATP)
MTLPAASPSSLAPRGHPEEAQRPLPSLPAGRRTSLAASFGHALRGLVELAAFERNMKLHVWAGLAVCVVGSELRLPMAAQLAVVLSTVLVLGAEAVNSALEALVDLHTRERREEARRVKDAAAGAVLALAVGAVAVAGVVVTRSWDGAAPALGQLRDHVAVDAAIVVAGAALLALRGRRPGLEIPVACAGLVLLALLAARTVCVPFTAMAFGLFILAAASAGYAFRQRRTP